MTIRVVLVDDQDLVRTGFRMILEEAPGIEVVGEAADGAGAVEMAARHSPDVIVMDVRMPNVDGITATARILQHDSSIRVLMLTTFDLDEYAFAALRAGADGFLLKDVPVDELVRAIEAVSSGDAVVSPRITRVLVDTYAASLPDGQSPPGLDRLTARERDVLHHVAEGLSNREIAARWVVSETTVKSHVASMLSKLGLPNRVHAVIYAYENGLVHDRR